MLDVDYVQFARLLDEINAVGLTEDQMKTVAKSMEVEPKDVRQLLNRASARVDELKPLMLKKTPLTEDQISEELAEGGKVEAIVAMDMSEIIGQLDDESMERVVDDLSERLGGTLDSIEHKVLFADNDVLYFKVTAKADDLGDDDEEEDDEDLEV